MRGRIEQALTRSRRIIRDGHEISPTFDITTPEGDFVIVCPMPDAHELRLARMGLVSRFMAYKLATGLVFASELMEPASVTAIGVSRRSCVAGVQMITRAPLAFGAIEWIEGVDQIGNEIPALLPRKSETLSALEIVELETAIKAFAPDVIEKVGM